MKNLLKHFYRSYFLYVLQVVVLIMGALFFQGGCPNEPNEKLLPPNPPNLFTVTSISESSLKIEWPKVYDSNIYFDVERADSSYSFIQLGVTDGVTASFTDYGLDRSKIYYYRVRGVRDSNLVGKYSQSVKVDFSLSIQLLRTLNNNIPLYLAISTDGTYLVGYGYSSTFNIWNTNNWTLLQPSDSNGGTINHAVVVRNSNYVVTSEYTLSPYYSRIKIWQLSDGALLRTIVADSLFFDAVQSIAVTPDGKTLVVGNGRGRLELWNLLDGSFKEVLNAVPDSIGHSSWQIVTSPKANIVAAASSYNLKIWNLDTKQLYVNFAGSFYRPVFNHGGSIFMYEDVNLIRLLRTTDWTYVNTLTTSLRVVAFSPNDSLMLFANDNIVKIARESDGTVLQSIYAHSNSIQSIVFFPSGQQFATSGYDKTVKIWSLSQIEQWHIIE